MKIEKLEQLYEFIKPDIKDVFSDTPYYTPVMTILYGIDEIIKIAKANSEKRDAS